LPKRVPADTLPRISYPRIQDPMARLPVHRLQLLGAALLFSTGGAAIKATTLSSWQVASFRSGVAALVLLLLLPAARRGWTWKTALVGVFYAATLVSFVTANKLTTAANTIFLQSTAPLYVLLLGPTLLREAVTRRDVLFMLVVGMGMVLFFVDPELPRATAPDPMRGNLIAAASGVFWAATVMGLRWVGSGTGRGDAALATVTLGNVIAFAACLPFALPVVGATRADWMTIAYLGAVQIGLAYVLLSSAIAHVPALEAATLLLVEPALNPVWAWAVHGERPGAWAAAGGALILGATALKTWLDAQPPAAHEPVPPSPG
jgi:drug/metabolite transporter, DME family